MDVYMIITTPSTQRDRGAEKARGDAYQFRVWRNKSPDPRVWNCRGGNEAMTRGGRYSHGLMGSCKVIARHCSITIFEKLRYVIYEQYQVLH